MFKTKDPKKFKGFDIPGHHLVGGGFFDEYVEMRVSEAWTIWGAANGVGSEAELLSRARGYRARSTSSVDPDPTIGCIILRNIFSPSAVARYLSPVLVRPRMGQGHFTRAVAAAYGHRCAVTASATFPSLEAAHTRHYEKLFRAA